MAKMSAMWKKYLPKLLIVTAIAVVAYLALRPGGWLNKKGTGVATSPSTNTAGGSATNPATSVANGSRTESEQMSVMRSFAFIGK